MPRAGFLNQSSEEVCFGTGGEQGQLGLEQSGKDLEQLSWESDRELKVELKEDGHGRGESPTAGAGSGSDYSGSPESLQQNSAEWDQEKMRGSSGKTQRKVKRERESDTFENFAKTAYQGTQTQQGGRDQMEPGWVQDALRQGGLQGPQ